LAIATIDINSPSLIFLFNYFLSSPRKTFYNNIKRKDMSWNPNSNKHKAMHGGYKQKPTKSSINSLLCLYADICQVSPEKLQKNKKGSQLKFDF
jgi:hypothetical protein